MSRYDRLSGSPQEARMQQEVAQLQQQAVMQQTMMQLTHICWEKCVKYADRTISSSESECVANCAKSYLNTTQFLQGRMVKAAQQQQQQGGYR
tara:strand:- start:496 stop:774 length:279 start_codon:yes stop_codon:yes gene_type:complete